MLPLWNHSSSDAGGTFYFQYFLFVARFYLIVFVIYIFTPNPISFYHLNTELTFLLFFPRGSEYTETSATYMS